jgi:hypothetical protein
LGDFIQKNKIGNDSDDKNNDYNLNDENSSDTDSEEHHNFVDETELESFTTPVDAAEGGLNVFLVFKDVMRGYYI